MRGIDFSSNWKFILDNQPGMHLLEYDDTSWKDVTLPHDWSIEKPFDKENGQACTGFLTGGIGWYRKRFITTRDMENQNVEVDFDGIYNRSTIYCNGQKVKFHPYGYSPCLVDITKYLNPVGNENVIAVCVDHSRYADSRWYTGSGIYRKVSMNILPEVHIPIWGTYFITPSVTRENAVVDGMVTLVNNKFQEITVKLKTTVFDPEEAVIKKFEQRVLLYGKTKREVNIRFDVENPDLWDINKGKRYRIKIQLICGDECIQEHDTRIGIRTFIFDINKGFFLNGVSKKIKGVCLHHECGAVGAAVPLDVWRRRLVKLQKCGCNAIRTAHNPASEDFLDLCDEMGFLVQEEFYDEWDNPKDKRFNGTEVPDQVSFITRGHAEFFQEFAKSDLQNTILRDRNHPCIIQWSIGNEIEWTYPKYNTVTGYFGANASGNYFWTLPPYSIDRIRENISKLPKEHYEIGETAHKLAAWTKEMDVTRPVIANCILPSASYESGYTDALDIVGYSYRQVVYDYGHKNYPDKPIMGTENLAQWHEWKAVNEREFISGMFIWTGVDYLGEGGGDNPWPKKGTSSGLLDFCGFEKPSYHMYKTLWNEEPHIHMETQLLKDSLYKINEYGELEEKEKDGWKQRLWFWQDVNPYWEYESGDMVVVEAYTNCEKAELFCNGRSIGIAALTENEDHILKWLLPYEKGELKVVGINQGIYLAKDYMVTPGKFSAIHMRTDKLEITTSLDSAAHIEIFLVDDKGLHISKEEKEVAFEITGPCRIHSIDNGSNRNVSNYQGMTVNTYHGKALLILQGEQEGIIEVIAKSGEVVFDKMEIKVRGTFEK